MALTRGIQLLSPLSDSKSIAQDIIKLTLSSLKLSGMGLLNAHKRAAGERYLMVVTACHSISVVRDMIE